MELIKPESIGSEGDTVGPGHGVALTYEGNKVEEYYIGTKEDAEEQAELLLSGKKFSYGV